MKNLQENLVKNLQEELDALNEKNAKIKKENSVKDDWPSIKRSYKYRKVTIIYPHDLAV